MRLKEVDTLNFLTKKQIRTDKIHIILYIRIDMTSLYHYLTPHIYLMTRWRCLTPSGLHLEQLQQ